MSATPEPTKKKRKRNTIVCLRCRKKKARCDKNLPCNQCIKAKCASECTYGSKPIWSTSPDNRAANQPAHNTVQLETPIDYSSKVYPEKEVFVPRNSNPLRIHLEDKQYLVGVNPMVRSTDMINLHMDLSRVEDYTHGSNDPKKSWSLPYRGIKVAARPIGFNEVSQQEHGASLFWSYSYNEERLRIFLAQMLRTRDPNVLKTTADYFGARFISNSPQSQQDAKAKVTLYGLALGLGYNLDCSEQDHFHILLGKIYPKKIVLVTYLEWFFAKVYPVYPIVDEAWIYEQVNRLFTYSMSGEVLLLVNSGSRVDFLILGIILLMTRLAYLSQLSNIRTQNEVTLMSTRIGNLSMADHPITLSAVDFAFELIHQGSSRRKVSFLYIQACMFKCITKMLALENEAALYAFDSDCSVSHLVLMAVSLSLERDPDNITNFPGEAKHRNLRRKIWYTLLIIDYQTVTIYHSARCIAPDSYNIVLPAFTKEGSNLSDLELEEASIAHLRDTFRAFEAAEDLIALNLNLQLNYPVVTVLEKLHDLEVTVAEKLGTTGSIIENAPSNRFTHVLGASKLRTQVVLRLFMASIYYFLHVYYLYKDDQNLEFFFFRKVLLIVYSELDWLSMELVVKSREFFNSNFALIMSPIILIYIHIYSMVSLGFFVRLRCSMIISQNSPEKLAHYQQLFNHNHSKVISKLKVTKLLGERYFFAWKCSKTHDFGCQVIYGTSLYETSVEQLEKTALKLTDLQILDLSATVSTESPLQFDDAQFLSDHCYADCDRVEERFLKGKDLYKNIQTDNFWIQLNSITEKDLVIFGLSTNLKTSKENGETHVVSTNSIPGVTLNVLPQPDLIFANTDIKPVLTPGNGAKYPLLPSMSNNGPAMTISQQDANIYASDIIPELRDLLDFNTMTTDLSLDDFFACSLKPNNMP